jgi:hypothetical protein
MPLDNVSNPQSVRHGHLVAELEEFLEAFLTALEDEVGSRVDVGSVADGGAKGLDIVRCNTIGESKDLADSFGDSNLVFRRVKSELHARMQRVKRKTRLVDLKVGIGRDDGSSTKVDTFSAQVSSESTLLALETLTESSNRLLTLGARDEDSSVL